MQNPATRTCWGKSSPLHGEVTEWNPLWRHLYDAAAISGRLWDEWLTPSIKMQFISVIGNEESARTLVLFIAGTHDLGKSTPSFACQVPILRDEMALAGLKIPDLPSIERRRCPHGSAGQVILMRWLQEKWAWSKMQSRSLGSVVGGHHGIPPDAGEINRLNDGSAFAERLMGDALFREVQDELLDDIALRTGATSYLSADAWKSLPQPLLSLLLSIVVVADWLSSDSELFPLTPVDDSRPLRQPTRDDENRLEYAWQKVTLPQPWHAQELHETAQQMLANRFALDPDAEIRPIQTAAVKAAQEMDSHGMMIIEAPMGEGKTEAALLAAEILASRTGAGGVMMALPTMATSDAMFSRFLSWMDRLPEADSDNALITSDIDGLSTGPRSVYLAHSKSSLNDEYSRLIRKSSPKDMDRDSQGLSPAQHRADVSGAYVDAWMRGSKKGVLADFVVGTIDQILFAALQARHVELRHLAFARKIVILDEVHSFDTYMNCYLERALEWLGALNVPVIALSATLPPEQRSKLVNAYQRGSSTLAPQQRLLSSSGGLRPSGWGTPKQTQETTIKPTSEPSVITFTKQNEPIIRPLLGNSETDRRVEVNIAEDDLDTLESLVTDAVSEGGCILVIRNTVARAQEAYQRLANSFGDDVVLIHSRFLALDRKDRENRLVHELGRPNPGVHRPRRRIVVATQVVEQSLDVDFDLIITDLAPMDLVLQRIGRLFRHKRSEEQRPPKLRIPKVIVVGVTDWSASPPTLPGGSQRIYRNHLLWRTAAQIIRIVAERKGIALPQDISLLVQEAYGQEPLGPAEWQDAMNAAKTEFLLRRDEDESAAESYRLPAPRLNADLTGWLDGRVGEAENNGKAQVRDSEDSFEILLVQTDENGQWSLPHWLSGKAGNLAGELLPQNEIPKPRLCRSLLGCSISLPSWVTQGKSGDKIITYLEQMMVDAWQNSWDIAGQLILPFNNNGEASIPGWNLHYDACIGLTVQSNSKERHDSATS